MRATTKQSDWYPRPVETLEGRVVDFDAKAMRMVINRDGEETVVAGRRVLWVEPGETSKDERKLIEAFDQGEFATVLTELSGVLQARPPVWRQQWLTMMAASAATQSRRSKIALELVSQLDRRPLPTMVVAWAPIAWTTQRPNDAMIENAIARLEDPSSLTRLVAASWLLSSSHRNKAIAVIETLAKGTNRADIAALASSVLWSTASPLEVKKQSEAWLRQLDAMAMTLSIGPTVALKRKFKSAGLNQAAQSLDWSLELVPVHPHPLLKTWAQ